MKKAAKLKKVNKIDYIEPNRAYEIYNYLKGWLNKWDYLQSIKEDYDLFQINSIYTKYAKKYLHERNEIRAEILADEKLYEQVKELAENDFLFFILIDAFSYDINRADKDVDGSPELPFMPFPHQLDLIHVLQYSKKHVHIEKARRQGASVILVHYLRWLLIFGKKQILFTTHVDLKSLDKGKLDVGKNSTMERVRWGLDKSLFIPNDWRDEKKYWNNKTMLYKTEDAQKHTITIGSNQLNGEVLGKKTGVGFAGDVFAGDEVEVVFDLYPNLADTLMGSFASSVNRVILYSTYRSMKFPFYKIKMNQSPRWDFITLRWQDNPICNSDWYENECAKLDNDKVLIARELDIDPTKVRHGVIWGTIGKHNYVTNLDTRGWKKVVGADFGGGESNTAFVFGYWHPKREVLYLHDLLKTTEMSEIEIAVYFKKIGYLGIAVVGDQSGSFQAATAGHDWYTLLKDVGIRVHGLNSNYMYRVRARMKTKFKGSEILINDKCGPLKQDLLGYAYKHGKIDKNEESHTGDAASFLGKYLYFPGSTIGFIG